MKFQNPVLRGMYPDPSMCEANGKFYLVCSTFQYFPGIPLFESEDLINWKQIGHVLTRKSQLLVEKNDTNSGIYAPTIRYNKGRFYMVVTNVENIGNFYVYTDDIYGEWSEPIKVEQGGIDPSLFFDDDGKVYFISNGNDSEGRGFIQMSEIDISNGKKITENEPLWYGTGGRYIEAPHMYKFGDYYYLLNAEVGTEYGHMVNLARSKNIKGPYEPCPKNPLLTNRNLGGYQLQGAGHGDIVQAKDGTWWFCHLAFRQQDKYALYHHLGRETCMEPVIWEDGWFYIGTKIAEKGICGDDVSSGYNKTQGYGCALMEVEAPEEHKFTPQNLNYCKTFENLSLKLDWCHICNPEYENYKLEKDYFEITANNRTIDTVTGTPSFIGIRSCEHEEQITCDVELLAGNENAQTGISMYMDCKHHYDVYITKKNGKYYAEAKLTIGPVKAIQKSIELSENKTCIKIISDCFFYSLGIETSNGFVELARAENKYLSSEVAGGFCGVFIGLYAQEGNAKGKFTSLCVKH